MADAMKLLPCPMCGGEAALLDYEARYGGLHYASRCPQCTSCGCSMGYFPTAKKAVEAWNCRAYMLAPEKAQSFDDARRKLIHCIEQWDGETEYYAEDIAALADDILDAFGGPPAREEAPAEGAGERIDWQAQDTVAGALHSILPLDVDWQHMRIAGRAFVDTLTALRNRTSEPEAGAVAWTWPDELEALAAHKASAGSFLAHNIRTSGSPGDGCDTPLYLHPAPVTADKLRVAVEAFEKIANRRSIVFGRGEMSGQEAFGIATDALAALNEQPQ